MTDTGTAAPSAGAPGALDGVLVADFSRVLAGPYATMLLADLGADVVKVERSGGDDTRSWGPPFTGSPPVAQATYFAAVNRNKRSVTLDLAAGSGRAAALALAVRADVVVENFRAGTMDRLGLGYRRVAEANPGVVYASITGFGTGAGADLPGYDLLVQAQGGLMSLTGAPAEPPTKVGVALVDVVTGLHAAVGILAALRNRDRTGVGQQVQVNLLSSLLSGLVNQAQAYVGAGVVPTRLGNRHPSICPYEPLAAADGPLVVAVGNDRQFAALVDALGTPGLAADPRFATNPARVAHRSELVALLEQALAVRPAADWESRLTRAGVPCGTVNDVGQAFALAERLGLAPVVTLDGDPGSAQVASPIGLAGTPASYRRRPPGLGEHTDQVLAWLAAAPGGPVSGKPRSR